MLGQLEKNMTFLDRAEMGSEIAFEAQKRLKNGSKVKKKKFVFNPKTSCHDAYMVEISKFCRL